MRRTRPLWHAIAGGAIAALLVAGCSGTESSPSSASGGSAGDRNAVQQDRAAPEALSGGGGNAAPDAKAPAQNKARIKITERAIIRTGTLRIEVADVPAARDRISALLPGDGYVSSEQSGTDQDGKTSSVQLVLRVPVADFDRVSADIRKLGAKVLENKHNAQDVTDEVVDVESRIASQQKSIERLRALIGQAKTVGEVVQVENELTTREAELESLQARQAALASQSTLSTLNVTLSAPPAKPKEPVDPDDDLGFLQGLSNGWNAFVGTVQVILTVVGAVIPFLVALALLGALPAWYYLRARRRRVASQSSL